MYAFTVSVLSRAIAIQIAYDRVSTIFPVNTRLSAKYDIPLAVDVTHLGSWPEIQMYL